MSELEQKIPNVFVEKTWKQPTVNPLMRGDDGVDPIYAAVGAALSRWETVEINLAQLFIVLCQPQSSIIGTKFERAFGSVESSASRRGMIRAVAEVYFDSLPSETSQRKELQKVLQAVQWASRRRDEIAHGSEMGVERDGRSLGCY